MKIHFVGCRGASMARLMDISRVFDIEVSGSDKAIAKSTNKKNIIGKDFLVYTNAVGSKNVEVLAAKARAIPMLERADYLGVVAKQYNKTIAVAGTHGKTSTTSMIAEIFRNKKACMHIGGDYDSLTTNPLETDFFITEACEYKRSFLALAPSLSIILNVELDHTDYFLGIDEYFFAYKQFAERSKRVLVYGDDDKLYSWAVANNYKTFGLKQRNTFYVANIVANNKGTKFDMMRGCGDSATVINLFVNACGNHSVLNALAAASGAAIMGIESNEIKEGLRRFKGVKRRQELLSSFGSVDIISDYAHHPTEIEALLQSLRHRGYGHITTVFQPHTYTRTASLKKEFATALATSNKIILLPVFAAREKEKTSGRSEVIAKELQAIEKSAELIETPSALYNELQNLIAEINVKNRTSSNAENNSEKSALIFCGAGNIDALAREFILI